MADIDENLAQREAIEVDRSKGDFKYEENYAFDAGIGLTPATVDYIAKVKGEEEWIREFRQKSLKIFQDLAMEKFNKNSGLVRKWGGGIMGLKTQAKLDKRAKALAAEEAKKAASLKR